VEIILKKNQGARITFPMIDSTAPKNFKAELSVAHTAFFINGTDSPAPLVINGTVAGISSSGMYILDLMAEELNHDLITIKFTAAGAADSAVIIRTFVVNIEDVVRSAVPANALAVDTSGNVEITQTAADKVWGSAARTLTSFGTLVSDIWTNAVRSLTEDVGITQAAADKVWSSTVRTLSSFGNLVSDIWNALTSWMTTPGSIGERLTNLNDISPAEVKIEAAAALEDSDLDHLVNNGTGVPVPAAGTFLDKMMNKDGTQSFNPSTDSLEALADAGGGGGPSADAIADAVWAEETKEITGGTVGSVSNAVDILQTAADRVWYLTT